MSQVKLVFATSNAKKFTEAAKALPGIQQVKVSLPELQGLDAEKIARQKLEVVLQEYPYAIEVAVMVDDSGNAWDGFGKNSVLPGPYASDFAREFGTVGLHELASRMGIKTGRTYTTIALRLPGRQSEVKLFRGEVKGRIVAPRSSDANEDFSQRTNFHFDPIFQPEGSSKTFGEMTIDEKNAHSHRGKALRLVREYLESQLQWQFPAV